MIDRRKTAVEIIRHWESYAQLQAALDADELLMKVSRNCGKLERSARLWYSMILNRIGVQDTQ